MIPLYLDQVCVRARIVEVSLFDVSYDLSEKPLKRDTQTVDWKPNEQAHLAFDWASHEIVHQGF